MRQREWQKDRHVHVGHDEEGRARQEKTQRVVFLFLFFFFLFERRPLHLLLILFLFLFLGRHLEEEARRPVVVCLELLHQENGTKERRVPCGVPRGAVTPLRPGNLRQRCRPASPEAGASVPVGRGASCALPPLSASHHRPRGLLNVVEGQLHGNRHLHVTVPCPEPAIPATLCSAAACASNFHRLLAPVRQRHSLAGGHLEQNRRLVVVVVVRIIEETACLSRLVPKCT